MKNRPPLNPSAVLYLEALKNSGRPLLETLPPHVARKLYHDARAAVTPEPPEVASSADQDIPGPHGALKIRVYRALGTSPSEPLPVLIFYHGGGWTIGDIDTHDVFCRELANITPCAVVSVDYGLGPESPFPIAIDDCAFATRWVAKNAAALKIDPARIAIGGDSAGGNIAAVVALEARDWSDLKIVFQLLIYPATDQRMNTPSYKENGEGYFLSTELISYFRHQYLGTENYSNWRASPLLAESVAGVAPALVITAGYDPLVDEGKAYADRLEAAGVTTEYICYEDMIHGFIRLGKVIPDAQIAVKKCAQVLAKAFA